VTSTPLQIVQDFVTGFIAAWPTKDADRLISFFDEDAVYQNGPLPPARGREAIRNALAASMEMGGEVAVDIIHIIADGDIVMTERVDHLSIINQTFSMPMMGIYEIRGGTIAAWRDYFDLNQFVSQLPPGD
jgi:limonene-1,2-epoxide hydrolase